VTLSLNHGMTSVEPKIDCSTCRNMRHVHNGVGFVRCPECYAKNLVMQELRTRHYPRAWGRCEPSTVMGAFGSTSDVAMSMNALLSGRVTLVHAYDLPTERRQAFTGGLVYGFLQNGWGAQVLDSADLAQRHFAKEAQQWVAIERTREAVIFTLGREVETRLGFYYLRQLLDRAVDHRLPFVLLTDYPLEQHAPRYPDLTAVIEAARFDQLNLPLGL
jgi:LSD1 subclass zinc finger protein